MANNKVIYGETTVMDITDTSAEADDVAQGKEFYTKAGVKTTGTHVDTTYTASSGVKIDSNDIQLDPCANSDIDEMFTSSTNDANTLTNPTKAINVEQLDYFKGKADTQYAKAESAGKTWHLTCTTAAATYTKTATLTANVNRDTDLANLHKGDIVYITFTYAHTSSTAARLYINSKYYTIKQNSCGTLTDVKSANSNSWSAGQTVKFIYTDDGYMTWYLLPVTAGGTGGSYSDFAALADAIGSGGNWVDASTAFCNGLASSDSNFNDFDGAMFVYEKLFAFVYVSFNIKISLSADYLTEHQVGTIPDFAKPAEKTASFGPSYQGVITIYNNTKILFTNFRANSANTHAGTCLFYLLATPYDPS